MLRFYEKLTQYSIDFLQKTCTFSQKISLFRRKIFICFEILIATIQLAFPFFRFLCIDLHCFILRGIACSCDFEILIRIVEIGISLLGTRISLIPEFQYAESSRPFPWLNFPLKSALGTCSQLPFPWNFRFM